MTADLVLAPPRRSPLNWPLALGLILVAAFVLPAIAALVWTPFGTTAGTPLAGPDATRWVGTDRLGRDLFTQLMSSALSSLLLAWFAALVTLLLAVPAGILLAVRLGREGPDLSLLALPAPALAIGLVVSGLGAPGNLTVILGVVLPGCVAVASAVARAFRPSWQRDYVTSARLAGLSPVSAAQRHVLPRFLPVLLAIGLDLLAAALLVEVTLSFAGLGTLPPGASLGLVLRDGQQFLALRPLLVIAPGLVAIGTAIAFMLVASGLRGGRDAAH